MRAKLVFTLPLILIYILFQPSCTRDKGLLPGKKLPKGFCDSLNVTYSGTIQPVIQANCAIKGCHVPGGGGNGDYTAYAGVKANVDNGTFRDRVLVKKDMPSSGPLPDSTLQRLDCWLQAGAPNN